MYERGKRKNTGTSPWARQRADSVRHISQSSNRSS